MIITAISSFIATFGFGILFNIKGKKLLLAALGGMIGALTYTLLKQAGLSEANALFLASVTFSLYSELLARLCKTPVTTFIICALIPLVPGGGMYETMNFAVSGDAVAALQKGLETLTYAGVLALGIVFVASMMRFIFHRPKQNQSPISKQ